MIARISDLKMREVINISDGRRLGLVEDLELDAETGLIKSIVVPGSPRFLWIFGRSEDIIIPWSKIQKIGYDVILVDATNYLERGEKNIHHKEIKTLSS